ncbi:hypothetical protein [Calothrix sp. PCC 6303]|uniref:hypothetical protein n=1 Tax=Calothrix sp. PCC 6303 TaxID=1170562 RepID=UPI00059F9A99|nr:hypothetical protein [Calothrix sp. PCC 6303]
MSTTRASSLNSSELRHLWSVVEGTQTSILLGSNDADLIQQLTRQIEFTGLFTSEQINRFNAYLRSRVLLIRDLASARAA